MMLTRRGRLAQAPRATWPVRVKNGYGGRSTGTSAVPQIADDFGTPRKSAEVGHFRTYHMSSEINILAAAAYYFFFAMSFASLCAQSMNSCATGLRVRFFNVTIPSGLRVIGSSIGSRLNAGLLAGNARTTRGTIAHRKPRSLD